jgi:hypothetical protein
VDYKKLRLSRILTAYGTMSAVRMTHSILRLARKRVKCKINIIIDAY